MISIGIIVALSAASIAGLIVYWQSVDETRTFIQETENSSQNKSQYSYKNELTTKMIPIGTIVALPAAFIAKLISFWRNIVEWIKKAANKIKDILGIMVDGTRTFIQRTANGFRNKSKYYYKNKLTTEWEEVVYTRSVPESEIPADILSKVQRQQIGVDVSTTNELQLVLDA